VSDATGAEKVGSLHRKPVPLSLGDQIEDVSMRLDATTAELAKQDRSGRPTRVILVGHSVGAYILMSLLDLRGRERRSSRDMAEQLPSDIIGGICLFPTVVDLYKSPNGIKARWVANIPYFSLFVHSLAKVLCTLLSFASLVKLVERLTGQPTQAATVTASFLASATGVRQAIFLAQHEILEMREDRWTDDVWTTTATSADSRDLGTNGTKLFFYWGADDHWIANSTRDAVIAARAATASEEGVKPHMEIDRLGTPHDFCTRPNHSAIVANKVAEYVRAAVTAARTGQ